MDTFIELVEGVQDDLTIGDESSLMPLALVKRYVNRAYRNKVAAIFRWTQLKDAQLTSSIADVDYYDYPQKWRPDSIWKLIVDGVDYEDPLAIDDYNYEIDNNYPAGNNNLWANDGLRYFIKPTPSSDGDFNIEIHGSKVPDPLGADGDVTIFSYHQPQLNEAIVLEAKAMLKAKGEEENSAQFASAEAKQICITEWGKIRQEQTKSEHTQASFNVPDFFGRRRTRGRIGNF